MDLRESCAPPANHVPGLLEAWTCAGLALDRLEALPPLTARPPRRLQAPPRLSQVPAAPPYICEACGCRPEDCACFPNGVDPDAGRCEVCGRWRRPCECEAELQELQEAELQELQEAEPQELQEAELQEAAAEPAAAPAQGPGRRNADGTLRPRGGRRRKEMTRWYSNGRGRDASTSASSLQR